MHGEGSAYEFERPLRRKHFYPVSFRFWPGAVVAAELPAINRNDSDCLGGDSRDRLLCGISHRRLIIHRFAAPSLCGYFVTMTPGGCQVPLPGGKIEGGVSVGQYKRIAR